ncbi:MAG: glycosyltransferase family 4 protein [bacterium]|nr:glycosyltransferase family 4 protein [bacterium]
MALHKIADLVVLTGSARAADVREWLATTPGPHPMFVEVPDRLGGKWMRWHRIPHFIHYQWWLRKAHRTAKQIIATMKIDAISHVTLSVYWLPTPANSLGVPSVWGPVGGAVKTPRDLWPLLGKSGVAQEVLDILGIRTMARLPASRRTARRATVAIVQNDETLHALPAEVQPNAVVLNHAVFNEVPPAESLEDKRYALWASLMETRKGGRLAIEALARASKDIRLVMVGDGPQRSALEQLATELGVADRIEFPGWVTRGEAIELMRHATTTVFTGLREEGGLALTEAFYTARRVIVLDHGGAGSIARRATDDSRVARVAIGSVDHVINGFAAALDSHFAATEADASPLLDRKAAIKELEQTILKAI